ncbi:o-succinylbenzoate synthase [Candidatus Marinamargulisbacteria bacterium SCGC AG-343-D04]|nr:o-succinylbenzoate synthase [Candidatus Marinamargulisbacteria bacterium SCGC AG-343-D04]
MTVTLSYIPYTIPFKKPFYIGHECVQEKSGIFVCIQDEGGLGIGDISPLPGLSLETLTDVERECQRCSSITLPSVSDDIKEMEIPLFSELPSVQFGIESALYSLLDRSSFTIKMNNLLMQGDVFRGEDSTMHVKYKVGRDCDQELLHILTLIDRCPSIQFRFDTNGLMNLDKSCDFFSKIPSSYIDYVEDPCDNPDDFDIFHQRTGLSFALDYRPNVSSYTRYSAGLKALIIKPTIVGSMRSIKALQADFKKCSLVFSSSFETAVGINAIARLSFYFNPDGVHGLSTCSYFQEPYLSSLEKSSWESLTSNRLYEWINSL